VVAHLGDLFFERHLRNEVVDALVGGQVGIEPGAGRGLLRGRGRLLSESRHGRKRSDGGDEAEETGESAAACVRAKSGHGEDGS